MMELMQEDLNILLSILFACLLLYLIIKLMIKPLIYLSRLFYKIMVGFFVLLLVNYTLGSMFLFQLGINPITAIVAGTLGMPGVALIYGAKFFFG